MLLDPAGTEATGCVGCAIGVVAGCVKWRVMHSPEMPLEVRVAGEGLGGAAGRTAGVTALTFSVKYVRI